MEEVEPETRIGRFEVLDLLGRGGMGAVYAARDPELERSVAIKLIVEPDTYMAREQHACRRPHTGERRPMTR